MFIYSNFKPTVMAIHGSASTASQWRQLARDLDGAADFIAPDLPGYGSAAHDHGSRLAALKHAVRRCRAPVHLVGHSFGGAVALKLANVIPERIASVTVYDPIAATGQHALAPELDAIWRDFGGEDDAEFVQAFLAFWAGETAWSKLNPQQRARLVAHAPGLRRDMKEVAKGMWSLDAPTYRGPLTILHGGCSPDVTRHMARSIAASHPQALIEQVEGLDHLTPLTHPDAINGKLCRTVTELGADLVRLGTGGPPANGCAATCTKSATAQKTPELTTRKRQRLTATILPAIRAIGMSSLRPM